MDLIHSLSNLEIETTHSSSQDVEEDGRNWLELPPDVMSLIFMKLGTVGILGSVQWVCTSLWKLSKQPHLFRSIHVAEVPTLFGHTVPSYSSWELSRRLAIEAIDRSCGQLEEISVMNFALDELLHYVCQKSESLRCLRLVDCSGVTNDGLTQVCKQFPQLEELELINCYLLTMGVIKTVGCLCPHLKSFRLNYWRYPLHSQSFDGHALVIAETMPELRNLHLFGQTLSDVGLRAILLGCPHLQSIDLRRCFNIKFEGDLKQMCANIKLRLPYDSTDDYEYAIRSFYDDDDYYDDYYDIGSEYDGYYDLYNYR